MGSPCRTTSYSIYLSIPGTGTAVGNGLAQISPWSRNYEMHDSMMGIRSIIPTSMKCTAVLRLYHAMHVSRVPCRDVAMIRTAHVDGKSQRQESGIATQVPGYHRSTRLSAVCVHLYQLASVLRMVEWSYCSFE